MPELGERISRMEQAALQTSNVSTKLKLMFSLVFVSLETEVNLKGIAEAYDNLSFSGYEKLTSLYAKLKEKLV